MADADAGNPGPEPEGGPRLHGRRALVRQSGGAGVAAMFAVLSGVAFDAVIAFTYGAGTASDAFFVASRIPLGLQAALTVASNQALVPLVSNWHTKEGAPETNRRVTLLATAAWLAGLVVAVVCAVAAWPLMAVTAPGLGADGIDAAAGVARIMFFVVPLEALGDVFEAFLNARYSFVLPSGAKVLRNVTAVVVIVVAGSSGSDPRTIAWGYLAGMALLVLVEVAWSAVKGWRYKPTLALGDASVREAGVLCVRPLAGAAINPLTRLVEQQFVSFLPAGAITISQYAYRVISAVGGTVFFRSVMVAMIPRMTEATTSGRDVEVARLTRTGVRIMLAISLPLTVVTAVLARPAIEAVFRRGKFDAEDALLLGWVLVAYALSLPGSGVQRALLGPFFARLDTRTPLRNTIYGNAANLVLLPVFIWIAGREDAWAVVAVGAAYSAAQYVHVGHAWWRLHHGLGIRLKGVGAFTLEVVVGSVVYGVVLYLAAAALGLYGELPRWQLLARTALAGVVGSIPAVAVAYVMRKRTRRKQPERGERVHEDRGHAGADESGRVDGEHAFGGGADAGDDDHER